MLTTPFEDASTGAETSTTTDTSQDPDETPDIGTARIPSSADDVASKEQLTPQASKVPVRFNDSIVGPDPSPPASTARPATPRSALKGSRASLPLIGAATPSPRKVVFSRRSACMDESGLETSMQMKSLSLTPEPLPETPRELDSMDATSTLSAEMSLPQPPKPCEPAAASWFSRVTSFGSKSVSPASSQIVEPKETQQAARSHISAQSHKGKEPSAGVLTNATQRQRTVSPSCASSDSRYPAPAITLSTTGFFTDDHFKHLHILYLKSLKTGFTQPGSIRPTLLARIGTKLTSADGEFAWVPNMRDVEVVERWYRDLEGRKTLARTVDWSNKNGKYRSVGWSEAYVCSRLFAILAMQESKGESGRGQGHK